MAYREGFYVMPSTLFRGVIRKGFYAFTLLCTTRSSTWRAARQIKKHLKN